MGSQKDPKKSLPARVGVGDGTQLIDFKNKALVYLYLDSLMPLRYGVFYMQPGGSSLDPRPDSGKYPIRGLEGALSARGADERSEERKGVWGKPCRAHPEARDLQASGVHSRCKKALESDTRHRSCFRVPKSVF